MKGRTNISGGGMNINADVENFTVASGSNVTAGNFVQYKNEKSDRKYDTNTGYGEVFYNSGNEAPKVLPCGNNKYVRRYKNNGEANVFWFNLVDVSDGFRILSSFSISSDNLPSFCLLDDGNIAICYMQQDNIFTIRIYSIETVFILLNTFNIENENIGEKGITHITQLGNSKIIVNQMNKIIVCNYDSETITERVYIDLGLKATLSGHDANPKIEGDNDWNLYSVDLDKFIIFPMFLYSSSSMDYVLYSCYLIQIEEGNSTVLNNITVLESRKSNLRKFGFCLNKALWGNAYAINGKILFSQGDDTNISEYDPGNIHDYFKTRIYYVQNDYIMQTSNIDALDIAIEGFGDLDKNVISGINIDSSATAQYVKENIFYISVLPQYKDLNKKSRTAIYRLEYNQNTGLFEQSNVVTFEGDSYKYRFGFGQFFESESGDVYYLYETQSSNSYEKTGRWLMKLTYKNGILEIGENTGMVENYTGSGAAIGVAKQSGKAGDVIEVYTPKV